MTHIYSRVCGARECVAPRAAGAARARLIRTSRHLAYSSPSSTVTQACNGRFTSLLAIARSIAAAAFAASIFIWRPAEALLEHSTYKMEVDEEGTNLGPDIILDVAQLEGSRVRATAL